jgi:hypothetical protein
MWLPARGRLSALVSDPGRLRTLRLTRQTAWGRAPYVGNPFVYTWKCASDQYGRWVAGERKIHYV